MTKKQAKRFYLYCVVALILAAIILGMSFVAQKAGMAYVGPFTFNTLRSFIGCVALLPLILLFGRYTEPALPAANSLLMKGGLLAGLVLFVAFSINQYCMIYATAGKAGFLTSLYIIFVPILAIFCKEKLKVNVIISVGLAIVGLYLLCVKSSSSTIAVWDILIAVSAFFFALHIMILGHYSKKVSAFKLSCLQFFVVGVLSLPLMLLFEQPQITSIVAGAVPILFIGVVVTGIAYTLQIFGQKGLRPVVATLILSSESIFAVLGGMIILGEVLTGREILGCIVMVCALVLSQVNMKKKA